MYMNNLMTNVLTLGGSDSSSHPETKVKYTQASGLSDWEGEIVGELTSSSIPNKSYIETVDIGTSVTKINVGSFQNCKYLTIVTISDNVTIIDYGAFCGCDKLTNVTIGNKVSVIGGQTFDDCPKIKILDFRKSTSIPALGGTNAFRGTPSNKEIIIPDSLYDNWIAAPNWSSTTNNIVNCIVKASQSSLGSL